MNSKRQGCIGVSYAAYYYSKKGYSVSLPVSDKQRYDLIVDKDGRLYRVEVKTSTHRVESGRLRFELATSGGNKTRERKVSISANDCDLVFLHDPVSGESWEYPTGALEGRKNITPPTSEALGL